MRHQDRKVHRLDFASLTSWMDAYSRDKVAILHEVTVGDLGWDHVEASIFRSAKHRFCDALTHSKVINHERFALLPQDVKKRIQLTNYLALVVRT